MLVPDPHVEDPASTITTSSSDSCVYGSAPVAAFTAAEAAG
jgi:hypothetical protein